MLVGFTHLIHIYLATGNVRHTRVSKLIVVSALMRFQSCGRDN